MNIFKRKQTFTLVVTTIQAGKTNVPYNKTWQYLHRELGIGSVLDKKLNLTAIDRQNLVQLLTNETGIDATTFDLSQLSEPTRTEIVSSVIDEKWATRKIREDIVYIRSLHEEVRLDKNYLIPEKGYIALPWKQALKHDHQAIIAIENLEVFLNSENVNWPSKLSLCDPLIVYRGDTEATPSAFKKFIENTTQDYYVFFDYDPAGFMMALTQPRLPSMVVPDTTIEIIEKCSKKVAYDKQINARTFISTFKSPTNLIANIQTIENHKVAVMQEKIVSSNLPLILLEIAP